MNVLKRLLGIIFAAGAIFGLKLYNMHESEKEIKADVLKMCNKNAGCISSVNKHYSKCFKSAYKVGGRRTPASFNNDKFFNCINSNAGKQVFMTLDQLKLETRDIARKEALKICEHDDNCISGVTAYADKCFKKSYNHNTKKVDKNNLDFDSYLICINTESKTELFVMRK